MSSPSQPSNQIQSFFTSSVFFAGLLTSAAVLVSSKAIFPIKPKSNKQTHQSGNLPLEQWVRSQKSRALQSLLAAFGPNGRNAPGTAAGTMIASPSRPGSYLDKETENANYFFHWTRDASLCLRVVLRKLDEAELGYCLLQDQVDDEDHSSLTHSLELVVQDFILLNRKIQHALNLSGGPLDGGLGEPKFLIDGSRFDEPWGRPQHDGPAIRASTLIRFAKHLIVNRPNRQRGLDYIASHLFHKDDPKSQIRLDIDHVCRTWYQPSFDLWEEVKAANGGHFYTLMVQRKSIQDFLHLIYSLPEDLQMSNEECDAYRLTLSNMDRRLEEFWNPTGLADREGGNNDPPRITTIPYSTKPHIVPTLDRVDGQPKPSQIDTAVLLAINHTAGPNQLEIWSPGSDRALATLDRLVEVFEKLYPINRSKAGAGIAIGRYPEDEYDGVNGNSIGHPWFLCTHAVTETTYLAINQFRRSLSIPVTSFNLPFLSRFLPDLNPPLVTTITTTTTATFETIERGSDRFRLLIKRMSEWADRFLIDVSSACSDGIEGMMSEQIDRVSSQMRGARELTWSYASFLTAVDARDGKVPN